MKRKGLKRKVVRALSHSLLLTCMAGTALRPVKAAHALEGAGPRPQSRSAFTSMTFETVAIGTRSGCTRAAKMVITNEIEWRRVWGIHTQGLTDAPAAPPVDFSRQVVMALLMGEQAGPNHSIEIAQIVSGPSETLVYFQVDAVTAEHTAGQEAIPSQPFHFAVVEKPSTPLRFANSFGASCFSCSKP